ncbi:MAG: Rieske (2Fe-2S) protein [Maribacter sp.]|nr:Rieske (2Fe-2S) protein [Maribacter sp.]
MERKEFIKTCGSACMGFSAFGALFNLQSCSSTKIITSPIDGENLIVPVSAFQIIKKNSLKYRPYIVARNENLRYPICVYRLSQTEYMALLMRCTHQGTELQVFGDKLQCPAHGSAFANNGDVTNGPASSGLRTFPVVIDNQQLKISLK